MLLLSFSLPPTIDIYYGEIFFFSHAFASFFFCFTYCNLCTLSRIPAVGPTARLRRGLPAVCCPPLVARPRPVAPSRPLMTAFVKATARLFLGSAVNRQIPHPRLEMFSSPCRARTGRGEARRKRGGYRGDDRERKEETDDDAAET